MKGISDERFPGPEFAWGRFERGRGRRGPHGHRGHGSGPGFGPGFGPGSGPGFGPGSGFGFGPGFGRAPRRASRGDVRAAILSLLAEAPSNGYGLIKTIAERTDGAWRPSPGSIYPTLQQLVDEDLIAALSEGRGTEFALTDAGRAYVAEHAEEMESAWSVNPDSSDRDFHQSIGKLMGVIHQFRSGVTEEQRAAAVEKLDETRRALYKILAD
jgi:DNA-binding PadR family transcriptional regulator